MSYDFVTDIDAATSLTFGVFGVFGDLFFDDWLLLSSVLKKNAGELAGTTLMYSIGDKPGELLFKPKYGEYERRLSLTFCFNTFGVKFFPAAKWRLTAPGEKLNVDRTVVEVDNVDDDDDDGAAWWSTIGIIGDSGEFAPFIFF